MKRISLIALILLAGLSCQTTKQNSSRTPASIVEEPEIDTALGEQLQPNEAEDIKKITESASEYIDRRYGEGRRPALRDAHAKAHGCVKAKFTVEKNLGPDLAQGVFAPRTTPYDAWIRFSNGDQENNPDANADARGMAIKLMGVKGDKILPDEKDAETQDFIMINSPIFIVDNLSQYLALVKVAHAKAWKKPFYRLGEGVRLVEGGIVLGKNIEMAARVGRTYIADPLKTQFWSMVPYRLGVGDHKQAIKFTARPCDAKGLISQDKSQLPKDPNYNYLQYAMEKSLTPKNPSVEEPGACFNFYIQKFKNFSETPIEVSTGEWREGAAPLIKVATIEIPKQIFNKGGNEGDQMRFCENLSFTPWHSLPEHKPLGSVNRARRVVYEAISKQRHLMNNAERREPTSLGNF